MNFEWKIDTETGDLILIVDGKERARIPEPNNIKFDCGRSGGSPISLDDIKAEIERALNLK